MKAIGEGFSGSEERTVKWLFESEGGRIVACGDGVGCGCGGSGWVGDFEGDGVVTGFNEGESWFLGGGKFDVLKRPRVAELFSFGILRGRGIELDYEGKRAVFFIGLESCKRLEVSMEVGNVEESGVLVVAPGGSIVEEPQGSVGSEDRIGGATDFDGEREVLDAGKVLGFIEASPLDKGTVPVPEEKAVVVVGGQAVCFFELGPVVKNGTGAGGAAAFLEDREFL